PPAERLLLAPQRRRRLPAGGDRHGHHRRPDPAPLTGRGIRRARQLARPFPWEAGGFWWERPWPRLPRHGIAAMAAPTGARATIGPFRRPPGETMFPRDARIEGYDPELAQAIADENRRQEDHVELIA